MGVHVYTRPTNPHTQLCLHAALISSLVSPGAHRQPGPVSAAPRQRLYTGRCSPTTSALLPLLTDHVSTAATASTPGAAHRPRQHCSNRLYAGRCSPITSALQPLLTDHVSTAAAAGGGKRRKESGSVNSLFHSAHAFRQWLHKSQPRTAPFCSHSQGGAVKKKLWGTTEDK